MCVVAIRVNLNSAWMCKNCDRAIAHSIKPSNKPTNSKCINTNVRFTDCSSKANTTPFRAFNQNQNCTIMKLHRMSATSKSSSQSRHRHSIIFEQHMGVRSRSCHSAFYTKYNTNESKNALIPTTYLLNVQSQHDTVSYILPKSKSVQSRVLSRRHWSELQ